MEIFIALLLLDGIENPIRIVIVIGKKQGMQILMHVGLAENVRVNLELMYGIDARARDDLRMKFSYQAFLKMWLSNCTILFSVWILGCVLYSFIVWKIDVAGIIKSTWLMVRIIIVMGFLAGLASAYPDIRGDHI